MADPIKIQRRHGFYVLVMVVGWVLPPVAVLLRFGFGSDFFLNILLTLCGYIPGHGHNFYLQNIRNNENRKRTPKWATKAGLVKDNVAKRKAKTQWANRYDERTPTRADGYQDDDEHPNGRTQRPREQGLLEPESFMDARSLSEWSPLASPACLLLLPLLPHPTLLQCSPPPRFRSTAGSLGGSGAMAVDPRQVVAGFLTLSMFVMLGNMIKHDHFSPGTELGLETTGAEFNTMKLDDNAESNSINTSGVESLMDTDEEVKPCWTKPSPKTQPSNGFVTFSLTMGPEYHISQITDAVVVARYLGATLVLPDIRGNELGNKRKFQDMYNVDKFMRSLDGVVEVIEELPDEVSAKKPAVIRVPNRVTESFITDTIQPIFQTNNHLRLAIIFSSVSLRPRETNNKDLDATACLAMFSGLELKHEYSEVARKMSDKLKEISKKSDGKVLAIDLRTDLLEKKSCKTTRGARRKGCYNADEVLGFLRNVGFSANTTIYLTETRWHEGLNDLKEEFPNTYTKDDIIPAENKGEFLKASNSDLARALDLEICSQSDMFIPAIPGLFYGHVTGKRIASGHTQILVPSQSSALTQASDFISTYISNKNHLAYKCYC